MSSLQVVGFRHYAMVTKNINHLYKKVGLPKKNVVFLLSETSNKWNIYIYWLKATKSSKNLNLKLDQVV